MGVGYRSPWFEPWTDALDIFVSVFILGDCSIRVFQTCNFIPGWFSPVAVKMICFKLQNTNIHIIGQQYSTFIQIIK